MHQLTLCIGSNIASRQAAIEDALAAIAHLARIDWHSGLHESRDVTGRGNNYLNLVVEGRTELDFNDLRSEMKALEARAGRTPESKTSGIMPLDVDIVVWDGQIVSEVDFNSKYFAACMADHF